VRERAYDLVHCHFIVPGGLVARPLAGRLGVPLVLTAHGSDVPGYNPDRFSWTHRMIAPAWVRIARAADVVTVASSYLAGLLAAASGRRVEVIPYAFEPRAASPAEARADRLLVATRLVDRKGVHTLLAALDGVPTGYEVLIAGDGPCLARLQAQARGLAIPVRFLGFVSRADLGCHYSKARIFAFPSTQENFPMVLLEAMAHGCAVVTTSAPGCAEVVGDAALIVPPGDVPALRGAVTRLMAEPGLVSELGRRGTERVRRFAPAQIAREFEELFLATGAREHR
jgi:glycosyltransferase involved in cell wall biosynthesis